MSDPGEQIHITPLERAIVAADKILEHLGTADAALGLMTAKVPLDYTELVDDPDVVIPVLEISRLMGMLGSLPWSHEIAYLMDSGETSRHIFIHPDPDKVPYARISSRDVSIDPDEEDRGPSLKNRQTTPREDEIIADDLTRVAG